VVLCYCNHRKWGGLGEGEAAKCGGRPGRRLKSTASKIENNGVFNGCQGQKALPTIFIFYLRQRSHKLPRPRRSQSVVGGGVVLPYQNDLDLSGAPFENKNALHSVTRMPTPKTGFSSIRMRPKGKCTPFTIWVFRKTVDGMLPSALHEV
jgi:hypothetical protein